MPLFGIPNIEKLEKKQDVDGLIAAIDYYKDPYIPGEAIEALSRIGGEEAVLGLCRKLYSWDERIRGAIVETLGEMGDTIAVSSLCDQFQFETDGKVLVKIIEALAKMDWEPENPAEKAIQCISRKDWDGCTKIGVAAFEVLNKMLSVGEAGLRENAALCLGMIGGHDAMEALIQNKIFDPLVLFGQEAVEPLVNSLADKNPTTTIMAARALGEIGEARAFEPLLELVKTEDANIRYAAIAALGKIDPGKAEKHLGQFWDDPDKRVRKAIADLLVKVDEELPFDSLVEKLEQGETGTRVAAIHALARTGNPKGIPLLIAMVDKYDEPVTEAALDGLVKYGSAAQKPVQEALKNREFLRTVLWFTRQKMSTFWVDPLFPLIGVLENKLRFEIWNRLVFYREKRFVDCLIRALQESDDEVRTTAAKHLGNIGDQSCVGQLSRLLQDPYYVEYSNWVEDDSSIYEDSSTYQGARGDPIHYHVQGKTYPVRQAAADALLKITQDPEVRRLATNAIVDKEEKITF